MKTFSHTLRESLWGDVKNQTVERFNRQFIVSLVDGNRGGEIKNEVRHQIVQDYEAT